MNRTPLAVLVPGLILFATAAFGAASVVPTLPVSALRAGQRAIVRTVFAGDSIETFEAEIIGVLPGGRADGDVILARATSPRVIETGVAQGMSGSPVYVGGKLIGALSSGWSFSKEPIFGITPIAEMLDVLDRPDSSHPQDTGGPVGTDPGSSAPRVRALSWSDADTLVTVVHAPAPGARPAHLALPLSAGGLDPAAFALASDLFAPLGLTVTPGGRAIASARPARLEPGSAVAVDVLRGDLNLSAIGTVTYVDGDRVLIFGHPFFQSGEVRLPLSTAHIIGILPSIATSFKLGVPGTPVGVATQDRRPAVAGRLGGVPALMPFGVNVGQPGVARRYRFETIEDRSLLPQLVATAAMNSVMEAGGGGAQQTVSWSLTAWRGGHVLAMRDRTAGDGPLSDMITGISAPLRFLYNNPFERFALDSARIDVSVAAGRRDWTLRAATLDPPAVRPGGTARLRAEIELWRGERRTVELLIPVPAELPNGHYVVWAGGGNDYDRFAASRLPSHYRPTSVVDAFQKLGQLEPADQLFATLWAKAPAIATGGDELPELPTSALALLAPPQAAGDRARRSEWALLAKASRTLDGVLHGELLLDLNVDDKAP